MKALFDFDPAETVPKLHSAFSYRPQILRNEISLRRHNGLLYIRKGSYCYEYENGTFTAKADSVIYLPYHSMPYRYQINAECAEVAAETLQIEFDLFSIKEQRQLSFSSHPILVGEDVCGNLCTMFEKVIYGCTESENARKLSVYGDLLRLLSMCAEHTEKSYNPAANRKIVPAVHYLQTHYNKPISVAELAALCHLSESQFRRLFYAVHGKSPIAYKNELLINAACNLLRAEEFKIGEIAEMLGFHDIYAFSHAFSKVMRVSPSMYAHQAQK